MTNIILPKDNVHLFRIELDQFASADFRHLLNEAEMDRADRFHFPIHQARFTITRGILRCVLSLYTQEPAEKIIFGYGDRGKPYLIDNPNQIYFNLSHSNNVAVIALIRDHEIGIDIEKMESQYNHEIAKRFFTEKENKDILNQPVDRQIAAFYRLWAAKEAIIKAVGEGLYVPLGDFSVAIDKHQQWVALQYQQVKKNYFLENIFVFQNYQCAFATESKVIEVQHWVWEKKGPKRIEF